MGNMTWRQCCSLYLGVMLISLYGCATTGSSDNESSHLNEKAVKFVVMNYESAVNNGDLDSLVALYSNDAVQVAPNEPSINGMSAIRERAEANHTVYTYELKTTNQVIHASGKIATFRANFSETLTSRSDESDSTTITGIWVLLFEKEPDGNWLIDTEIWNDEKPIN